MGFLELSPSSSTTRAFPCSRKYPLMQSHTVLSPSLTLINNRCILARSEKRVNKRPAGSLLAIFSFFSVLDIIHFENYKTIQNTNECTLYCFVLQRPLVFLALPEALNLTCQMKLALWSTNFSMKMSAIFFKQMKKHYIFPKFSTYM